MNAKKARLPGIRRTNNDKKTTAKKPMTKKIKLDKSAARTALGDDYWQIEITISSEDRVHLAGMVLRPLPPPPPVDTSRVIEWVRNALVS